MEVEVVQQETEVEEVAEVAEEGEMEVAEMEAAEEGVAEVAGVVKGVGAPSSRWGSIRSSGNRKRPRNHRLRSVASCCCRK